MTSQGEIAARASDAQFEYVDEEDTESAVEKKHHRTVRTPAGARQYGLPIGSVIPSEGVPQLSLFPVDVDRPSKAKFKSKDRLTKFRQKTGSAYQSDVYGKDPELDEVLREAFQLDTGMFNTEITNVVWDYNTLEVYGTINTGTGRKVGTFERLIYMPSEDTSEWTMENAWLSVDPNYQGQGFAEAFYNQVEAVLWEEGLERVTVHANVDVGGYAWTRRGFQWNPDHATENRENIVDRLRMTTYTLAQMRNAQNSGRIDYFIAQMEDWALDIEGNVDVAEWPTPQELAMLGTDLTWTVRTQQGKEFPMWPGKMLMLGSNWYGMYQITEPLKKKAYDGVEYRRLVQRFLAELGDDWEPNDAFEPTEDDTDLNIFYADLMMPPDYDSIEEKARYVRTPAGAEHFGQPIGSLIVPDEIQGGIDLLQNIQLSPRWFGSGSSRSKRRVSKPKKTTTTRKPAAKRSASDQVVPQYEYVDEKGKKHLVFSQFKKGVTPSRYELQPLTQRQVDEVLARKGTPWDRTKPSRRTLNPASPKAKPHSKTTPEWHWVRDEDADPELQEARDIARSNEPAHPTWTSIVNGWWVNQSRQWSENATKNQRGSAEDRRRRRAAVWRKYGGVEKGYIVCVHCGRKLDNNQEPKKTDSSPNAFELDKIVSTGQGGRYSDIQNLVPSCMRCNNQRKDAPIPWNFPKPSWAGTKPKGGGLKYAFPPYNPTAENSPTYGMSERDYEAIKKKYERLQAWPEGKWSLDGVPAREAYKRKDGTRER